MDLSMTKIRRSLLWRLFLESPHMILMIENLVGIYVMYTFQSSFFPIKMQAPFLGFFLFQIKILVYYTVYQLCYFQPFLQLVYRRCPTSLLLVCVKLPRATTTERQKQQQHEFHSALWAFTIQKVPISRLKMPIVQCPRKKNVQ